MDAQTGQLLFFGAIILVIVLLMFRNGRKRQRDAAALTESLKPGAEVMTTFGLFGTVESIDEAENRIVLRTGPGSTVTIHRQAMGRVVTPVADDGTQVNGEPVVLDDAAADPAFGERAGEPVDLEKRDDAARGAGKNAD
ncbi:preprotein translocase subunit YajC [Amnibacterium endophyticum]|uniref:Preprotein translocase subunit YajC n=1 Tax=Amnibacterium endophyticum TaxID=2109337 RepID=A0ABW4LI54_9MICO